MAAGIGIERLPVIVGVGECLDRAIDLRASKEPLSLMQEALRLAEEDSGAQLINTIDSLYIVNEISWPYVDAATQLSEQLGISPSHRHYGEVGGQTPARFIHEAARRIFDGHAEVAAICGAESQNTVRRAERDGVSLPWIPRLENFQPVRGANYQKPIARRLKAATPTNVYPFYENATLAAWKQTPAEAYRASSELWARYAAVAAQREKSWSRETKDAGTIGSVTSQNRLIAWPYPKLMTANPDVNMGAAVILTSFGKARALGIAEERLVFVWGGAAASEPRDYLARDGYARSTAMEAVLGEALGVARENGQPLARYELYSCFPVVPKLAVRVPGMSAQIAPTVTGGLTFFGAPLNNYMTHAAVAMVQALRYSGDAGLLFGQGEYVTKHHALVVANRPPRVLRLSQTNDAQCEADLRRGSVPQFRDTHTGPATLETFMVLFDRDGNVTHGVVIARAPDDARIMAIVPPEDNATLALLMDSAQSPVGHTGSARTAGDVIAWQAG